MGQKVRFYTDEHVAKAVVHGLRHRGVDVLTVPDTRLLSATDEEHLVRARTEGRVLFTQDPDFLRCMRQVWRTPESSTRPKGRRSATSSAG